MKLFLLLYAQVCWLLPTFTCLAVFTSAFAVSQETTSSELFSLKAYLLHLPLLCMVMWWTDIDLLTGALWPQVLGSFVLFPYCIVWQFFFFWIMYFVFWGTAVNTKSKVPLFRLINLFAHLMPNTWECMFPWSKGPFCHLAIAINLRSVFTYNSSFQHFAGTWAGCTLLNLQVC